MQPTRSKSLLHRSRDAAYNLFYDTGISNLFYQLKGRKRGIITYHNVLERKELPESDRYGADVTSRVMEYHLDFLCRNFQILPYSVLDDPSAQGFFISFDDGMLNNYTVLLPILEKYGVQAMFAVCPDGVSRRIPHTWRDHLFLILKLFADQKESILLPINGYQEPFPVDYTAVDFLNMQLKEWVYFNQVSNLYGLVEEICTRNGIPYRAAGFDPDRFDFMDWEQVIDLHQRGHIIASHTQSHRVMRFLSYEEKWDELKYSREEISDHLRARVDYIVYPYGGEKEVDPETVALAAQIGYKRGFMNVQHQLYGSESHAIPRFGLPGNESESHLHATVSGLASFLKGKAV